METDKLSRLIDNFIYLTKKILNSERLQPNINESTKSSYNKVIFYLENQKISEKRDALINSILFVQQRLEIIIKSFYRKEHRNWLLSRIRNRDWQRQKLIQLGLKKPKLNS